MIEMDNSVKYAVEVMIKDNTVVLGGEITGNVDLSNVIGINYTIGDLKMKSGKVSKVSDNKRFPGVREIFELPIYCELIK